MLINILYFIIGVALTLVWIKVVNRKTPLNFQEIVKDKFWLIITGSLIVAIGYLYFYLPQVFKWLATDVWGVPNSTIAEDGKTKVLQLTDLGPLGDIYGSLNTLFTSATLAFVVYATLLQRQANQDAREAMEKQLQQAREDTEKQLEQAYEATERQIRNAQELADIQLEHARQNSKEQLELAKATHDAQMQESKHAIFSTSFNMLLNEKSKILDGIRISLGENNFQRMFRLIAYYFSSKICGDWSSKKLNNDNDQELLEDIKAFIKSELNSSNLPEQLSTYFFCNISIIGLIKKSTLNQTDKAFYFRLLSYTMTELEQLTFLCYSCISIDLRNQLKETGIFDIYFSEKYHKFIFTNFEPSMFSHQFVIKKWNEYLLQQTPT